MRQDHPPKITTEHLRLLLGGAGPLWLVFAPDRAAFADGHIPGSLAAEDSQLLAALPRGAPVVVYGENPRAARARHLAARLAAAGRDARWYDGGLQAWSAAGLPVERSSGSGAAS